MPSATATLVNNYLPYGIPPWDGPPSIDHLIPEMDQAVDVVLLVRRDVREQGAASRDLHWMIQWHRGARMDEGEKRHVITRCQLVRENVLSEDYPELGEVGQPLPFLTNWGPITTASSGVTYNNPTRFPVFIIKSMSKEERYRLAEIARTTPICAADGEWNCQDWAKTVLETAVQQGLIDQGQYDGVIAKTESVEPLVE